jgi:magnesium transporter
VWSGSKVIADDLQGEDLGDVLELHADASAWWVLPRQADHLSLQLTDAARALDLDRLTLHDLTAEDGRAKFEDLGQARLITTNVVLLDQDRVELTVRAVSLVVSDRAVICLADAAGPAFDPAALLNAKVDLLARGGLETALQLVVGAVVTTYETVVEWLEDQSDQLADSLFEGRPLHKQEQLRAFRLRRVLSHLRRLTEPMRSVLNELLDSDPAQEALAARHWRIIRDRHLRVANAVDALRETLASVFDTSLSLADERSNAIVKKLTGWAAIIAVPTLVTGFVGMNVAFPLSGTAAGFWLYLAIMVAAVVALFLVFRRRHWI